MLLTRSRAQALIGPALFVASLLTATAPVCAAERADRDPLLNVVGVAIVRGGEAILLAVRVSDGRQDQWRFRSLDTHDLPQPIRSVALARSSTKLLLESGAGPLVLDLTTEYRHNQPLQDVELSDVSMDGSRGGARHRLPSQRFVSVHDGTVRVIDDTARVLSEHASAGATAAAIADDRALLIAGSDGRISVCDVSSSDGDQCRERPGRVESEVVAVLAQSSLPVGATDHRFFVLSGSVESTHIVDPESATEAGLPVRRAEAALRARLELEDVGATAAQVTAAVDALLREAPSTVAAAGASIIDWRFFVVTPDEELYAPVLQFVHREPTYPDAFETLEMLGGATAVGTPRQVANVLLVRYLRLTAAERRERCTIYFRTLSFPGSWVVQYWFYYPFDVGGLGAHLHDPEHLFVEVDKLGGTIRRVVGAGHGYVAGNNIYSADRMGALPVDLPLFAMVEFGKHGTATDIDHDGTFTPGLDENEYRERAKIWGVRDVIGTINNQLIAYDRTMTVTRSLRDALAPASVRSRFPQETALAGGACCRLVGLPEGPPDAAPCTASTTACATASVIGHPDARDPESILKDWVFPHAFLRLVYGLGPRERLNSLGLGYAVDLYRMPLLGRAVPMPGRVGGEVFAWHQDLTVADVDSCLADCRRAMGVGVGVRYEQFISNLFGIYSAVRVFTPLTQDIWITFGPMVEVPIVNRSNVNFQAGLSFRPYASPRFEMKLSVGVWKPKANRFGTRPGIDEDRWAVPRK